MILPLILSLTLAGQPKENPCTNPQPSAECEALLADIALHWEKEYHEERAAHISTLKLCAETNSITPEIPESKLWVYIVVGSVVAVLASGATALAFSL